MVDRMIEREREGRRKKGMKRRERGMKSRSRKRRRLNRKVASPMTVLYARIRNR